MHPFVTIFGRDVSTYSLTAAAGICAVILLVWQLAKRRGHAPEDEVIMLLVAILGVLAGGCILYGITNLPLLARVVSSFADYPSVTAWLADVASCFGGSVFYGGLIGGAVVGMIFAHAKGWKFGDHLDIFAVAIPLFHTFGRLGCFFAGCCYGAEADWGITFTDSLAPGANGVPRIPVQLFEAAFELILFCVLLKLFLARKLPGRLIGIWCVAYPIWRFCIEFFRGDTYRGFLFDLSTSQLISIAVLIVGIVVLVRGTKTGAPATPKAHPEVEPQP